MGRLHRCRVAICIASAAMHVTPYAQCADAVGTAADPRIRVVPYSADEVYRLRGYAGYQIDLEFESGESFVGLGAGDLDSLAFAAQANHLFLKPRAAGGETNLTVLTSMRTYHFDYSASERRPDPDSGEVIYALRFQYRPNATQLEAPVTERRFADAALRRWRNRDYWYCGSHELKPEAASDDGVQTRLRFGARQELPAIFVRNDDGSESLINFNIDAGEVVVQRTARQLILRRGRLQGCIVNRGFSGGGERLQSGTMAPDVERRTRATPP